LIRVAFLRRKRLRRRSEHKGIHRESHRRIRARRRKAGPSVEVLTLGGLVRYVVWFVIDLEVRNLTDSVDGFLRSKRYLIHDRDPLFTEAFRALLRAAGIECLILGNDRDRYNVQWVPSRP
jgi:hypothetical protein